MKSRVYTANAIIARPPSDVFEFSIDFEKLHTWTGAIDSGFVDKPPVKKGTKFFEVYHLRGQDQKADCKVTKFLANKEWGFESKLAGYKACGTYVFRETKEGSTEVLAEAWIETNNLFKISMMFHLISDYFAQRQLDKNMSDLKSQLN